MICSRLRSNRKDNRIGIGKRLSRLIGCQLYIYLKLIVAMLQRHHIRSKYVRTVSDSTVVSRRQISPFASGLCWILCSHPHVTITILSTMPCPQLVNPSDFICYRRVGKKSSVCLPRHTERQTLPRLDYEQIVYIVDRVSNANLYQALIQAQSESRSLKYEIGINLVPTVLSTTL